MTLVPVVSVYATTYRTSEPCPVCLVAPGIFTVFRSGEVTKPLTVYLQFDGTATPGKDYREIPSPVVIPAGQTSVNLFVVPNNDDLVEGPEVVRVTVMLPELATRGYGVSPGTDQALITIGDNEADAPAARMDIVNPVGGSQIAEGVPIGVTVLGAWDRGELDRPIDFFADGVLIGTVTPPQLGRPTLEGLPSQHTFWWTNPPPGNYTLVARTTLMPGLVVTTPEVKITVGNPPFNTVVRIEATRPIAEESSYPLKRMPLRGEFAITRSGSTFQPLSVFVHYSGTATPGVDFSAVPFLVTIPAGTNSTTLGITAIPDDFAEGLETVVATLSQCPPETDPPMGIPCYGGFEIDPLHDHATVFIRDDGTTESSIVISAPKSGEEFVEGSPVSIQATAIDLNGAITRVEFYDGDVFLGESTILFVRAPDPGTPIFHEFVWKSAGLGRHVLTVRGLDAAGTKVISQPVTITVVGIGSAPMVTVTARDAFGVEPSAGKEVDVAAFKVHRTGSLDADLTVGFSMHGKALNGLDYERLVEFVTIPKGRRSVLVTITPIQDGIPEGRETVILKLEGPVTDQFPPPYTVGVPARAIAVISDRPWVHGKSPAECVLLPEGFAHVCFVADPLLAYRVEASADLVSWEAIFHGVPVGDALHMVDDQAADHSRRFYRLVAEPADPDL